MKKYNNIDDLFKEELSSYSNNSGKDLWPDIEKSMFGRKKPILLLILVASALFLLLIGYYYFDGFKPSEKLEIYDTATNTENSISIRKDNTIKTTLYSETVNETKDDKSNKKYGSIIDTLINKNDENNEIINKVKSDEFGSNILVLRQKNISNALVRYNQNRINGRRSKFAINSYDNGIDSRDNQLRITELYEKNTIIKAYSYLSSSIGRMYFKNSADTYTWSVDMGIGYRYNKFYFETGIEYQTVRQQGDFRIEYATRDSVGYYNEVISFELNPNSPGQIHYNTKITTVYDSIKHITLTSPEYTYKYLNIPVIVGFKFYDNERFNLSVQSGLVFSLLNEIISPTPTFNNPDANLIEIVNRTPERTKISYRLHLGIRANTKIYRGISLYIQPEFSTWLNSVYKVTGSIKQELPYSTGIRAGLYYNF